MLSWPLLSVLKYTNNTFFPPFFLGGVQLAEALDKTFASLNQPADYKELKGKDPSSVELLHKIEQVAKKIQCR